MDITALTPFFNLGLMGAIFVLWLFGWISPKWVIDDKNKTIEEQKETISLERQRADAALEAADLSRKLLESFKEGLKSGDTR